MWSILLVHGPRENWPTWPRENGSRSLGNLNIAIFLAPITAKDSARAICQISNSSFRALQLHAHSSRLGRQKGRAKATKRWNPANNPMSPNIYNPLFNLHLNPVLLLPQARKQTSAKSGDLQST